jgi:hypothetical protein
MKPLVWLVPAVIFAAYAIQPAALAQEKAAEEKTVAPGASGLDALPAETTLLVQVPNLSSLIAKVKKSPFYRLKDQRDLAGAVRRMETFIEEIRNQARAETGVDLLDLLGAVEGEVLLAFGDILPLIKQVAESASSFQAPQIDPESVPILLVLDAGAGSARFKSGIDKLLDFARNKGAKVEEEDFYSGKIVTVHRPAEASDGPEKFYLGTHRSRHFFTLNRRLLQQNLVNLAPSTKEGRLSQEPRFLETYRATGENRDLFVYLNIKPITAAIGQFFSNNPFGFLWVKAEQLFIGRSLNNLGFSVTLEEKGLRQELLIHNSGAADGMLGWFKTEPFAPAPSSIIPDDVGSFSTLGVNLERAFEAVKEIGDLILGFQAGGNVEALFEQQLGMKFKDLTRSFGARMHFFATPARPDQPLGGFSAIVELKDDAPLKTLTEKLQELAPGQLEQKKYMNREVFSAGDPEGEMNPAFSVSDRLFIFSMKAENVEKVIRRIGKELPGFAANADFKRLSGMLPARVAGLSFSEADYMAKTLAEVGTMLQEIPVFDPPPELLSLLAELGKILGASLSYSSWTGEGYYSDTRVEYRK